MATILLSNDDGFDAPGLAALAEVLADLGRIVVVAPDRDQSGVSHAITMHLPLRVRERAADRYSVQGTPTDCVHLAVLHLLRDDPPALMVSGINDGYNLADDATYSGTVAAALEAQVLGVPSIAISACRRPAADLDVAARVARELAAEALDRGLPPDTFLNVNVPPGEPTVLRLTRQGRRRPADRVEERRDPRGRLYFWIGGQPAGTRRGQGSDLDAVERGEISVTPMHRDWTNPAALPALEGWPLSFAAEVGS